MEEFLIRNGFSLVVLIVSGVAGYAVGNYKTESHGIEIASLKKSRMEQAADLVRLDKEIALARQEIHANNARATELIASLKEAIAASEARVIAHVNRLVESLGE